MIVKVTDKLEPAATQAEPDAEMMIDTSKMNRGQAQALEVTEAARDTSSTEGAFASELLLGRFRWEQLLPFPRQSDEDRAVGDELVRAVSRFLVKNLDPEEVDETRTIPAKVIRGLHDLGMFRMKVPREYGGLGLSQVNYNRVMTAISSHCGSTAVLISAHQSIGVPQPLKMFGTEAQKEKYLRMISDGAITAFALTEPNVGSDPAQMETTAELSKDGTHYVLNGIKQWTTNGPIADLMVVMARTSFVGTNGRSRPRITAFVVESKWKGVETLHRCDFMGLRGIQNGIMRFKNVKVPAENVIWGEGKGLKLALLTLNTGRLTLPAACTGMGKQCLSIARRWGREREQWGRAIGKHEVGAEKIASIASRTFAMDAMTKLTSHWADEGKDIRMEAAMAKLFCSETSWLVVDQTMQLRGGRGYEKASSLKARGEDGLPVERMMREARINMIIEGTSEIMRLYLAREALDPHLRVAADLLKPGTAMSKKIRAVRALARFYGVWYPMRWLGSILPAPSKAPNSLRGHLRYTRRTSNRLARALFHSMVRYGPKLERRQIILGSLMDIATDLMAMSATCAYAASLNDHRAGQLADHFCKLTRVRISERFRTIGTAKRLQPGKLAERVLGDDLLWLERGIIAAGNDVNLEDSTMIATGVARAGPQTD